MFKITQNTVQSFSLAEILLMAAINQMEANRIPPARSEACLKRRAARTEEAPIAA